MIDDPNDGIILEVIVGTYEEFVVGYQLRKFKDKYIFDQSFTNHAHSSSVRSVAASGYCVASGGGDEAVRILSVAKRKDIGTLQQQEGTITCIEFFEDSHLFTGSEDGTICVWDTKSWECLKTLRGHKKGVNDISVHPSGKILLSVSKDKAQRSWNLIKGRSAYITNLKVVAHLIKWTPSGMHFVVAVENKLDIYDLSSGSVVHTIDFGKRISSIAFISDDIVALGGDQETIELYDIKNKKSLLKFKAHENRVKGLHCMPSTFKGSEDGTRWLLSLSSDSKVKLWTIDLEQLDQEPSLLATVDTTCRPTCFTVWTPRAKKKERATKRVAIEELNEEEVDESDEKSGEEAEDKRKIVPKRSPKEPKRSKRNKVA